MKQASGLLLGSLLLVLASGCSGDNRIVGHELRQEGRWYGDFGVVGNLNNITIKTGSSLSTLKVVGDGNKIFVEDHVPCGKVEIWGANNEVSVPEGLRLRQAIVGNGNNVIRRPALLLDASGNPIAPPPGMQPMGERMPPPSGPSPGASQRAPGAAPQQSPPGSVPY